MADREQTSQTSATQAGTVTLGSDTVVNRMGYGAMRLPGPGIWGKPANPAEARAVLRRAVELGVNFIDTAAFYGPEVSNKLIAEALYPYPEGLVIATKFGARRPSDKSWVAALHPQELRVACEDNLRQLRLDSLHLVHCRYMEGADVPFAEVVGTVADLQREGKIQHIGVSNITLSQLREAQSITKVVSVQNLYNLEYRQDKNVLDACIEEHIAFAPFFPLAIGRLGQTGGVVAEVAQKHGATPAQVALAWLLALAPTMIVIPGTSSVRHLEENIAAGAIRLTPEEITAIERSAVVRDTLPDYR